MSTDTIAVVIDGKTEYTFDDNSFSAMLKAYEGHKKSAPVGGKEEA